jgi:putative membrane protein
MLHGLDSCGLRAPFQSRVRRRAVHNRAHRGWKCRRSPRCVAVGAHLWKVRGFPEKPMRILAKALIALVALEHLGFLVLEMFFWERPIGLETFHNSAEAAKFSAALAGNQGLYNGFLAAGLLWSLWQGRRDTKVFFLLCVVVAGVYGAATAFASILFVQALPALLALATTLLADDSRSP